MAGPVLSSLGLGPSFEAQVSDAWQIGARTPPCEGAVATLSRPTGDTADWVDADGTTRGNGLETEPCTSEEQAARTSSDAIPADLVTLAIMRFSSEAANHDNNGCGRPTDWTAGDAPTTIGGHDR